ncbi:MAG: hypothetical protein KKG60_04100 [Nanoarchaeota archaeon]|nr:hypothetical protein [Nanoarchaeota archaeon]
MSDIEETKSKVLNLIKMKGPVLPVQIAREIGENSIFAGAVLSELVRNKHILVSHSKVGGSPVYYVSEQKPKLEGLYKYLKEKERKIFDILKKEKVLKDSEIEPWQRVAVREINDFSVKLTVASTEEVFWKWYSVPNSEAEKIIIGMSAEKKEEIEPEEPEIGQPIPEDVQMALGDVGAEQNVIADVVRIEPKKKDSGEYALNLFRGFLGRMGAEIIEEKVVRKSKDIESVVRMPSNAGPVHFFVKFKDKKKVNDAELSLAQTRAKARNCLLFFLGTGDMTKKAQVYAEKHNIIFKKFSR